MAVDYEALKKEALAVGFSHVGELDADTIDLKPEVRAACAENKCHSYGKNWVCPPSCGTLEECGDGTLTYVGCILIE